MRLNLTEQETILAALFGVYQKPSPGVVRGGVGDPVTLPTLPGAPSRMRRDRSGKRPVIVRGR